MGKIKGFMEFQRVTAPCRPVQTRLKDYREVAERLPSDEIARQAARCMDCGIPFCHSIGCPLFNYIPEWNDSVYRGQWEDAFSRLELTNNFPEITGRICPAPCEGACTLAINDNPVTIREIELAVAENAFEQGLIRPRPPAVSTGKKIVVIGSGPAGLAAAQQLARCGHDVLVIEKSDRPGGVLRFGIPDFKLEKNVIDRRIEQMQQEGVHFETSVNAGEDVSTHYLKKSFDAILLACGAGAARDLQVRGRKLEGIHYAMEYLSQANRSVFAGVPENGSLTAAGKNVLVIGGGDTGSDCVGTANRQGAKKVYQLEIMPEPQSWDNPWNPEWPDPPNILRTTSSHSEGCVREWAVMTRRFEGADGRVTRAHCVRVVWKDQDGTPRPVKAAGTEFSLDVDLVLLAMGFSGVEHNRLITGMNVYLDASDTIAIDDSHMTSTPGIFAAGDSVSGPSLVVRAISQGRAAARGIHAYVMEHSLRESYNNQATYTPGSILQ